MTYTICFFGPLDHPRMKSIVFMSGTTSPVAVGIKEAKLLQTGGRYNSQMLYTIWPLLTF